MNRKERRRLQKEQERLHNKMMKAIIKRVEEGKSLSEVMAGIGGIPLSHCSKHGPYTYDSLCPCYDAEGKNSWGQTYEENFIAAWAHKLKKPTRR